MVVGYIMLSFVIGINLFAWWSEFSMTEEEHRKEYNGYGKEI